MHSQRHHFFENYEKHKQDLNPVQQWSQKGRFPYRLALCITIILLTSCQIYYISDNTIDHSRQFTRALNYYLLDHTGFDFYWAGSFNFNYPIQQYFTLDSFNDMLVNMWSFMVEFESNVYGSVDQVQLNRTLMNLTVMYTNGSIMAYPWELGEGIQEPFGFDDVPSIKGVVTQMEYMEILMEGIPVGDTKWSIKMFVENYSQASLIVTLITDEDLDLKAEHISNIVAAGLMLCLLLFGKKEGIPYFQLLLLTALATSAALSFTKVTLTTQLISDGIACCLCWLWLLKIIPQKGIYHVSMLLGKSYVLVGRLFISFMPLFFGFAILAYCVFCRYAHQFSSFKQTLLSLFYICYYNMTYEQMIVTVRADPISTIFFFIFILLFTFSVYSSMLVSIFCSFAWDRREEEMQRDILNNLKIKCSNCDFVYKYEEKLVVKVVDERGRYDEDKGKKLRELYIRRLRNGAKQIDIIVGESRLLEEQLEDRGKIRRLKKMLANMLKEKYNIVQNTLKKFS